MESFNNPNQNHKKRVLKKVREQYIRKKPDWNDPRDIDPSTRLLCTGEVHPIIPCIGLVEIDRKICVEIEFVHFQYNVSSVTIENNMGSSKLILGFSPNKDSSSTPWEYAVKRLESYGDLELATWAHKIRACFANHSLSMNKYFEQVYSGEKSVNFSLEKARTKAALMCESIESQYPYFKGVFLSKKNSTDLVTVTMSDGFLKEMGHSPESFLLQQKKKGITPIVPKESATTKNFGMAFLNYFMGNYQPTNEENDALYDKDGTRRKCIMQNVLILDPTPEGILIYNYFILKKEKSVNTMWSFRGENTLSKYKKTQGDRMQEEEGLDSYQGIGQTKVDTNGF